MADSDGALQDIKREKNNLVGFKAKKPWELFADRSVRWQLLTIILLNAAQQLNGVNAVRRTSLPVTTSMTSHKKLELLLV